MLLIEGVLESKNLCSESGSKWPITYGWTHFEASDWSKYGVLGSKNLFSESCSQRPYYYREVISDFGFGGSKLASLALRAVRRCRRLASAPGAARLVFVNKIRFNFIGEQLCC